LESGDGGDQQQRHGQQHRDKIQPDDDDHDDENNKIKREREKEKEFNQNKSEIRFFSIIFRRRELN